MQASLTLGAPDKRAALVVVVSPVGGQTVGAADLRAQADNAITQLGALDLGGITHDTARVNGVTYQVATAGVSPANEGRGAAGADTAVTVLAPARRSAIYIFLGAVSRSRIAGDSNPPFDVEQQELQASFDTIVLS